MSAELKDRQEQIEKLRGELIESIKKVDTDDKPPSGEDIQFHKRMEEGLGKFCDDVAELLKTHESEEMKQLRDQIEEISKKAMSTPTVGLPGEPDWFRDPKGRIKSFHARHRADNGDGGNLFMDMYKAARQNDHKAAERISEYEAAVRSEARIKAWATGDLETVDLILPDVQQALPFLQAAAKVVNLCRELRISTTSVEFPRYTSGLTAEHVAEGDTKPDDEPTFELDLARVYTIAGMSEVPNSLLEDYPAARGWISTELGRSCGVQEDRDVISGDGVGEPTGILEHSDITAREATDVNADGAITGRDVIEAVFRAMQDVRVTGLTEPTDIAMNPAVWTDIVLSFESNIGYLYGPPGASDSVPKGEPQARLLGLPVTQDAYIPNTYGSTTNQSPVIVGNFQDAVVLRRSPFRIDVDTSLGFKVNTTWFRGEERMGFIVARPASFKVVTNVVASA